jgi:multiple antibiotic resistance protein
MNWLFKDFVFLWTVIDPIGTVPVFIALAAGRSAAQQRRIAWRAIAVSAGILLFFIVGGQVLLEALSIELSAFQIAGGIIMFIFALDMVFGEAKPEEEKHLAEQLPAHGNDIAIYPLAVPSIAGPGAMMAVVLLTDNHRYNMLHQAAVAGTMLFVLAVTLVFLLMAGRVQRLIGDAGASIVSRVMGLIIAAMAASTVLAGVKAYFKIEG